MISAEVLVPCFGVGRPSNDGYWLGANMLMYRIGDGRMVVTSLRLLENLGKHPAASWIVTNLVGAGRTKLGYKDGLKLWRNRFGLRF